MLSSLSSYGQENLNTKWILSIDFGIQEHDKRLFDFPPKENLLAMQPETFGTYQFGVSAVRKIVRKGKLKLLGGFGLSSELGTFLRPFDKRFRKDFGSEELRFTDRYYQGLIQFPIYLKYKIAKSLDFSLNILPQFNFFTIADNTKDKSFSWWRLDFYSVEVNPGIEYTTSKFVFGLKYRFFQIKKIDKILFNSILKDPRADQTFETENPFKLWFSIGYDF